jgi:hypothetical protein
VGLFNDNILFTMKKPTKQQAKFGRVMREFYKGTLKSSSGTKVTSRDQALAIAASESKMKLKSKRKPAARKKA